MHSFSLLFSCFYSYSIYLVLLMFGISSTLYAAEQLMIEVVTSDAYPVTGVKSLQRKEIIVKLYNLDDGKRLVIQMGANLSGTQEEAKKTLQKRFKNMGDAAVKRQFMQAYQGLIVGTQYGLSRYPAVIFEQGQSVVYGVTDIPHSLTLYRQWKAKQ